MQVMSLLTLTYLVCVRNNGNTPSCAQANGVKPKRMACTVNAPQMQKNPNIFELKVSTSRSLCYFQSSMLESSQVKWKYPRTSARHCLHLGLWAIAISKNPHYAPLPNMWFTLKADKSNWCRLKKKISTHLKGGKKVGKGGCEPRLCLRECAHRRLDREWDKNAAIWGI